MEDEPRSVEEFAEGIGRQVRMYRRLAGMTQNDLCEQCSIFRTYLSRIENGIANPSLTVLWDIAAALKVKPWKLLQEVESKKRPTEQEFAKRVTKGRHESPMALLRKAKLR